MDRKADYYGTCFQEIYNKQDDFRTDAINTEEEKT